MPSESDPDAAVIVIAVLFWRNECVWLPKLWPTIKRLMRPSCGDEWNDGLEPSSVRLTLTLLPSVVLTSQFNSSKQTNKGGGRRRNSENISRRHLFGMASTDDSEDEIFKKFSRDSSEILSLEEILGRFV